MSAVVLLPHGLLGSLVALVLIIFGRTQNDLAYAGTVGDWQRLDDHVEAIARLVRISVIAFFDGLACTLFDCLVCGSVPRRD
jgi:hypothetical protein